MSTAVQSIEPGVVRVGHEIIDASTIVLTAGIVPSVVASEMSVMHDQRGRIGVDATMRCRSHPNVWALGDCAAIPGPDGPRTRRWRSIPFVKRDALAETLDSGGRVIYVESLSKSMLPTLRMSPAAAPSSQNIVFALAAESGMR